MKKITSLLLALLLLFSFASCGKNEGSDTEPVKLSFKSADSYETLKKYDGMPVQINGYVATSSPADGSFLFLMNLPYQNCPFCVPNTTQLSNTIEVYPEKGETFSYTTQAIRVTGTLQVAPEGDYFTDEYDYQFAFKIVDADYKILKDEDLAIDVALWQKIAGSSVINDLYEMQNYIYFVSHWTGYYVNTFVNSDGETVKGYYLYPTDALHFLQTDGAQWNYGYQEGYFDSLVKKIEAVDSEKLTDLVNNVRDAEAFAEEALNELLNGQYTATQMYLEEFDNTDYVYTLNRQSELDAEYEKIYSDFSDWLAAWEL